MAFKYPGDASLPTQRLLGLIRELRELRDDFTAEAQTPSALRYAIIFSEIWEIPDRATKGGVFAAYQALRLLDQDPSMENCRFVIKHLPNSEAAKRAHHILEED